MGFLRAHGYTIFSGLSVSETTELKRRLHSIERRVFRATHATLNEEGLHD